MRNALNLYIIIHSELPTVINLYGKYNVWVIQCVKNFHSIPNQGN